jgi:hypothetical protein
MPGTQRDGPRFNHGTANQLVILISISFSPHIAKMVVLTMTPSILEGLQLLNGAVDRERDTGGGGLPHSGAEGGPPGGQLGPEPSLKHAAVGNPVSHGQIVDLWKSLRTVGHQEYTLERLLKGSEVYVPPPVPKPEPVSWLLP